MANKLFQDQNFQSFSNKFAIARARIPAASFTIINHVTLSILIPIINLNYHPNTKAPLNPKVAFNTFPFVFIFGNKGSIAILVPKDKIDSMIEQVSIFKSFPTFSICQKNSLGRFYKVLKDQIQSRSFEIQSANVSVVKFI